MRVSQIVRAAFILGATTLVLGEIAARLLTHTGENGMAMIGRYVLLPYRPARATVDAWSARTAGGTYLVDDVDLGWSLRAGGTSEFYQANAQGIRADPACTYSSEIPAGKVRLLALGDSFTHADEVKNDEAWTHVLEALCGDLEVLNMGVPGYGTDQAFLRWKKSGGQFQADIVLLGIWPENMCRNLNVVRFYLVPGAMYSSKPRFELHDHELGLINAPVIRGAALAQMLAEPESAPLLEHDTWYTRDETVWMLYQNSRLLRFVDTLWHMKRRRDQRQRMYTGEDPSAIDLTVAIAERFRDEVRAKGTIPLVLLIPMRDLFDLHRQEDGFPLVRALRSSGVDVIDLGPAIARDVENGEKELFLPSGHFSAKGNRLFAQELASALEPWIEKARTKR
jgi:hypothetical protein